MIEASSVDGGDVRLRISLMDIQDEAEARALALREASRVADRLSISLGKLVTEPRLAQEALSETTLDQAGNRLSQQKVGSTLPLSTFGYCVNKLGETSLSDLKNALSENAPAGESNYPLFRIALTATDPASKFLALYQILALLIGDNQDKIEKFIRAQGKVEVTRTKPHKKEKAKFQEETVYTRLRNEYMHDRRSIYEEHNHKRRYVTIADVRTEMESNLDGLISLVQAPIIVSSSHLRGVWGQTPQA